MITSIELKNYGPLKDLKWDDLGKINLVIGNNGGGKSYLLRALFTTLRAAEICEQYGNKYPPQKYLANLLKLYFHADKISRLVSFGSTEPLTVSVVCDDEKKLQYSFGMDADDDEKINSNDYQEKNFPAWQKNHSVFLLVREFLSSYRTIINPQIPWPYVDPEIMHDFRNEFQGSLEGGAGKKSDENFACILEKMRDKYHDQRLLDGFTAERNMEGEWVFKDDAEPPHILSFSMIAEGFKKLAIFERLLSTGHITSTSIVLIDEVDNALHPEAISSLLELIWEMSQKGVQFILSSHSYFVVNKLYNISLREKTSIPVLSLDGNKTYADNLCRGLPDNPIIRESARLYDDLIEINNRKGK